MSVYTLKQNSRELSYYLLFGTATLFAIALAAAIVWYLIPQTTHLNSAGLVSDFPSSEYPYSVRDADVWIVNLDGDLRAYHRHTPFRWTLPENSYQSCKYAWNTATNLFQDPCYGAKFRLDGVMLDGPALRDLDQYAVSIVDGQVLVDTSQFISGACRTLPAGWDYDSWKTQGPPPLCSLQE